MEYVLYAVAAALTALEFGLRGLWPTNAGGKLAFIAMVAAWPLVWAYGLYQMVRLVAAQASEDFGRK